MLEPPVSIIQITDPHLGERAGATLMGLDTDHSFVRVREQALAQRRYIQRRLAGLLSTLS